MITTCKAYFLYHNLEWDFVIEIMTGRDIDLIILLLARFLQQIMIIALDFHIYRHQIYYFNFKQINRYNIKSK